jgi:hypothetical protein
VVGYVDDGQRGELLWVLSSVLNRRGAVVVGCH